MSVAGRLTRRQVLQLLASLAGGAALAGEPPKAGGDNGIGGTGYQPGDNGIGGTGFIGAIRRFGIAAGAVFAFITSFDDVILAIFLTNVRSRTLPKLMFEGVAHQIDPVITAAAALITLFTFAMLGMNLFWSRSRVRGT